MNKFIDLKKPWHNHLYYVYVHGYRENEEEIPPVLYKVGHIKEIKKEMRSLNRNFDVFKVW